MSWTVSKRFRFEAAHHLPDHDGKCARIHGHSYWLIVEASSKDLEDDGPKKGMVVDFSDLAQPVRKIIGERLDHFLLNSTVDVDDCPTAEKLAEWIFGELLGDVPGLSAVTVGETEDSWTEYRP